MIAVIYQEHADEAEEAKLRRQFCEPAGGPPSSYEIEAEAWSRYARVSPDVADALELDPDRPWGVG